MRIAGPLLVLTTMIGCDAPEPDDAPTPGLTAGEADPFLFDPNALGTVEFPVSCNAAAAEKMEHGLALLHHMMYTEADLVFVSAVEADSSCAMSYWGRAMTLIHPMWPDVPTSGQLERGTEFVQRARAAGPGSERERGYIDAVAGYFRDAQRRTEGERLTSFNQGWQRVHERFPGDLEATAFLALSNLALGENRLAPRDDIARLAAAQLQRLLAIVPDHPGGQHYAVHAYDYLPEDSWAAEVARSYATLAPEVPHALHMPTHIFTSLGLWSESIELNRRSATAAWEQGRRSMGLDNHYPHALAYLIYAYLQTGQDSLAREVVERVSTVEGPFSQLNRMVVAAHFSGIPVRYALERHAWSEAAQLDVRAVGAFAWEEYPQFDAIPYFGRAIGSARAGDVAGAGIALAALRAALDRAGPQGTASWLIWDGQTLLMAAEAWTEYANQNFDRAILMMEDAAERAVSASALGPGQLLPATEQLADMYLALGRSREALTAYQAVLAGSPNRFNSLCGAARAAEQLRDSSQARTHRSLLEEMVRDHNPTRDCPQL